MEENLRNFPYLRMTTCFLRDKESYTSLFATLESFGLCSGLRVNHEKTEIFALGSNNLEDKDLNDHKICETIKILGVYFGYDGKQRNDLNYRQTIKSITYVEMEKLIYFGQNPNYQNFRNPQVNV